MASGITLKFGARTRALTWRRKRHQLRNARQRSTVYLYCNIKHSRSGQSFQSYEKSDILPAVGNGLPGVTQPRFASDALVEEKQYQIQIGLVASSSGPYGSHNAWPFCIRTIIGSAFLLIARVALPKASEPSVLHVSQLVSTDLPSRRPNHDADPYSRRCRVTSFTAAAPIRPRTACFVCRSDEARRGLADPPQRCRSAQDPEPIGATSIP